ncbi:protein phosphatase 2C domain-containing protein [Streptomyces bikiniensis]|uniref:protein phosphatase 2C domain-containing protein n=1 Tax=Streptomyces bikiniensis TaxID=1896 RepID=UPI0004C01A71|nr:protein phosphatase 2C domain-containing protein [Streptomyces bikiniensis]
MTQQGDSWWDKLYDESAPDTGPTASGDTLDDRFDTAARATTGPPGGAPADTTVPPDAKSPTRPAGPGPRAAAPAPAPKSTAPEPVPPPVPTAPPAPPVPTTPPAPPAPVAPPTPVAAPEPPAPAPHAPGPPVPGRAPWEAAETGPRTFPAPPVEAPTVQVPVPPDPPGQDPDPEPEPGEEKERDPEKEQASARTDHAPTVQVPVPRPRTGFVGSRPPTYDPEPTALPVARPGELADVVADTVLDGARYGTCTLRAASVRGDSARFRGEPRRDALLTARFGHDEAALVLVAVAAGSRAAEDAHLAAADACRWIAEAVCRSHNRLSEDIRSGRRGDLKSGLHRLTDRTYGKLRARAAERDLAPDEYTASLRCLLLPADPGCRTRVFFGIGGGGLFRLRDGAWQDIEPLLPERAAVTGAPVVGFGSPPATPATPEATEEGDRLTMDLGITTAPGPLVEEPVPPPAEPFRFRASVARPGDTLLLASPGLAEPMRGEPDLARELADRWAGAEPPGLAAFLADTQLRVTGYADDRTGVAVWEA